MRSGALVLLVVAALGCGPSRAVEEPIELETFVSDFALAFCHRIYTCCQAIDIPSVSPGSDEAACAAEMTENARANAQFLLGFRGITFDTAQARHCLDVLERGPCGSIFESEYGTIIACQNLFPGTRAAGDVCEDGQECTSGRCLGHCQDAPAATCLKNEYLDPEPNVCVARLEGGNSCMNSRQCLEGAGCVDGICTKRVPDGQSCVSPQACVGTCGPMGLCRPGICRGP
jgi:hypothetical protein